MKQKILFSKPEPKKKEINQPRESFELREPMVALIERRQRQLLVHSYIYYEKNTNIIDDETFDLWSTEVVALQEKYQHEFKQTEYYSQFKNFDGSTGMDLPYKLPWVIAAGDNLLRIAREGKVQPF